MSFQNRCIIPTAGGLSTLSVPLRGGRENNLALIDVMIDNSQRWQTRHWRTITSAYNRSPFFEFYEPSLSTLYATRFDHLWEWNLALVRWISGQFGSEVQFELIPEDQGINPQPQELLPKNFQEQRFTTGLPVYQQVFMDRIGFQANVSVIDMLFCAGRNSARLLTR